jgi:hypothetical protein
MPFISYAQNYEGVMLWRALPDLAVQVPGKSAEVTGSATVNLRSVPGQRVVTQAI